ncbi:MULTISPECIES: VOC family protein [unclassified Modestobacter]|uniref:VOC family protein n=1 Tax=unclassified Modestobacter TaxID=2643866 RepID=UPI0022AAF1A3|nr:MULTISPECIES: VOC family protein [unclassified Modestobacter]MCZ2827010.1 VOC family protein [Modestobacter sp. VKM Ac-2981]MCZ2855294.1 VOC family protein [Modestobacter sp. VKM Ac-2982]
MADGPPVSLGAVNVAARDPRALASFWAGLLGSEIAGEHGDFVFVSAREPDGFAMSFWPHPGDRPDQPAQHLDLTVPWGTRTAAVDRAIALGAVHRWDVLDEVPWVQWSTLADPEGNLFCLAEHPPAG